MRAVVANSSKGSASRRGWDFVGAHGRSRADLHLADCAKHVLRNNGAALAIISNAVPLDTWVRFPRRNDLEAVGHRPLEMHDAHLTQTQQKREKQDCRRLHRVSSSRHGGQSSVIVQL